MTRKREIKQLMALGIQRNDATGFVNTCRAIKAQGKKIMVPYIAPIDPPPVVVVHRDIKTLSVVHAVGPCFDGWAGIEYQKKYIKESMAMELAQALLDNNYVKITERPSPEKTWPWTEYRATIDVVIPEEVPV